MRYPRGFIGLLVTLVLCASAAAQVKLAWKFEKGQRFYQETTSQLKQTTKLQGRESTQDVENATVTSFLVKDRSADGSVVLEQKIESIRTGGKPAVSNEVAKLLNEMHGAAFVITLSPALKITKFEGYDELVKRIGRDDPATMGVVQTLLSRETLQSSTEEAFAFLPREAVKKDQTWERKLTASLGPIGTVTGTHAYTYEGPAPLDGKTLQEISVVAQLAYQPPRGDPGLLPFQITRGELKVESGKGALWFDDKLGRLVQSKMNLRLRGTLTFVLSGQESTVELVQDQTVMIRITEERPTVK